MKVIGFAGKGGTGKTTLAALFLKSLLENVKKEILVIDSDPNECLPRVLGVKDCLRLSDVVKKYQGKTTNPEQFSEDFATMLVMNEQEGFDILVMGRGESEGCYCIINHLLRSSFERNILTGGYSYDYILMDCEAGIEHISRKTSASIDELVIVTDASRMGLETIKRIKDVSAEVESKVKNFYVVGNKVQSEEVSAEIEKAANELGMKYLGSIPYDALIEEFNFREKNLLEIPKESRAYKEAKKMLNI
ncbi:MAG: AAA family ATPase [Candidatus Hydrothermarchaeota archaeon]|nr:AAA family ATPase [Candidatus Hydrothermarchaeota archaeon]